MNEVAYGRLQEPQCRPAREVATEKQPLPQSIDRASFELDGLEKTLSVLESRLGDVLRCHGHAEACGNGDDTPRPSLSRHTENISTIAARISAMQARIVTLMDNLDL